MWCIQFGLGVMVFHQMSFNFLGVKGLRGESAISLQEQMDHQPYSFILPSQFCMVSGQDLFGVLGM